MTYNIHQIDANKNKRDLWCIQWNMLSIENQCVCIFGFEKLYLILAKSTNDSRIALYNQNTFFIW